MVIMPINEWARLGLIMLLCLIFAGIGYSEGKKSME